MQLKKCIFLKSVYVHRLIESLQGANQGSSCFDASGDTCEVAQQEDCILFGAVRKTLAGGLHSVWGGKKNLQLNAVISLVVSLD